MNWKWTDGISAFAAVVFLFLTEVLHLSGVIAEQQLDDYEVICNVVLLGILILGLFLWKPSSPNANHAAGSRLAGNMAVSLVAFPMNIDVFGHVIRTEQLLTDLWGWHTLWMICTLLQLLLLSPLGTQLKEQTKDFLRRGKKITIDMISVFGNIVETVKNGDKNMLVTVGIGAALWAVYLAVRVSGGKAAVLFSDMRFWAESLLLWIVYLFVVLLIRLLPEIVRQAGTALKDLNLKHVLAGLAAAAVFVAVMCVGTALLKVISLILAAASLLLMAARRADERTGVNSEGGERSKNNSIKKKDLTIFFLFFSVIPLSVVTVLTFLFHEGTELFPNGISDFTAWLEFWNEALEIVRMLLELFSIG